jgi:tetratricopeptide (TPR) repeat protein
MVVKSGSVKIESRKLDSILGLYDDTGALISLDKALAIDPKDKDALYDEGFEQLGNYTGVIEYYDKVLAIDPHYVRAVLRLAI